MRFLATLAASCTLLAPVLAQENPPLVPEVAPETVPETVPETTPNVTDEPIENAKYELRWRPNVDVIRVMRLTAEQNISAGAGQQMTQKVELDYAMQVLALGEDGSFTTRTTFRAVRLNRIAPGVRENFDSARPPQKISTEFTIYKALTGSSLTIRFSNRGQMLEVKGVDAFYNRLFAALGVKPNDREMMTAIAKSGAGEESFRNIGNTIASFPDEFVGLGQTWPKRDTVMSSANLIYDGLCSLQSVTGRNARIAITSQIKPDPSRKKPGPNALNSLRGTQTGHYDINLDSGWTTGARLTQIMNAKLLANGQMTSPDNKTKGTPFKIISTFNLRTLGVKSAS